MDSISKLNNHDVNWHNLKQYDVIFSK